MTGTHLEDLQLQSKCHKMLNCRSSYSYLFPTLQVSVRRGVCYERPKNALVEGFSAFIGLGILFYYSPTRHKSLIPVECQTQLAKHSASPTMRGDSSSQFQRYHTRFIHAILNYWISLTVDWANIS